MKYLITESKLEDVAIKYLDKFYGDLEEITNEDWPGMLFFVKDKKIYMDISMNQNYLHIDYDTIWSELETIFFLDDDTIKLVINKWVDKSFNLANTKPRIRPYKFNYETFFQD